MSDLYKDIIIGVMFAIGILGFISGEYIVSSTLFAASAIASNVMLTRRITREVK